MATEVDKTWQLFLFSNGNYNAIYIAIGFPAAWHLHLLVSSLPLAKGSCVWCLLWLLLFGLAAMAKEGSTFSIDIKLDGSNYKE